MADSVKRNAGSIGYVELIYAVKNDLGYADVKNADGEYVRASPESVTAAAASLKDVPADLRYTMTNAPGKTAYPISGTVVDGHCTRSSRVRRARRS